MIDCPEFCQCESCFRREAWRTHDILDSARHAWETYTNTMQLFSENFFDVTLIGADELKLELPSDPDDTVDP